MERRYQFWQQFVAAFFASVFSIYNGVLGNALIAGLLALAGALFVRALWLTWQHENAEKVAILAWLICLFCPLYRAYEESAETLLFIFPLIIVLFAIFSIKVASLLSTLVFICSFFISLKHAEQIISWEQVIRFNGALFLTIALSSLNAFLIRYQRAELKLRADTDALTKALNRHALHIRLKESLMDYQRYDQSATILMLDVDWFKQINDENGHLIGDQVLCELVELLRTRLRKNDLVFRYGGEEFAILLPHIDRNQGVTVAEMLRDIVEHHVFTHNISLTISIGIANARKDDNVTTWLARADNRLYMAKNHRNCIVFNNLYAVNAEQ